MSRSDSVLFVGSWKHRRLHDSVFFYVLTAIGITETTSTSVEWRTIERWWVYLCLPNERHEKDQTMRCVETRAQHEKCTEMIYVAPVQIAIVKNIVPNAYYTLQNTWSKCCWDDDWWPARWVIVCFRLFFFFALAKSIYQSIWLLTEQIY